MRRLNVPEIEDQTWCPRLLRDGATDWLRFAADTTGAFACVIPKIERAMAATGSREVLDLCSGGGGPWRSLSSQLSEGGALRVELSDLHPNRRAFTKLEEECRGRVGFRAEPVDAVSVPESFRGVRTMFNGFHHFAPTLARRVLSDAVAKRNPICIFEACTHRMLGCALVLVQTPALLLLTPLLLPHSPSRLLLTYALPLIPALVAFDGLASMLRLYSVDELREMTAELPTYEWDIGCTKIPHTPFSVRHVVGIARDAR